MYTYEELQKANAEIKTIDFKGNDYAEVSQRIKAFRSVCPHGSIITEMLSNENGVCIFRATITNEEGIMLGTGTASEVKGEGWINQTSYIENCETSAVGRALGMCGFGIDTAVASADEVKKAAEQQEEKKKAKKEKTPRAKLISKLNEKGIDVEEYAKEKGLDKNATPERFTELLKELEG